MDPAGEAGAVDGALGAGAGEADAAMSVLPPVEGASVLEPDAASPALLPAVPAGLGEEYRSLYHPEPLNWIAGAVRVRSRVPPQWGQVVRGASENFWIFSTRRLHCWHWYS